MAVLTTTIILQRCRSTWFTWKQDLQQMIATVVVQCNLQEYTTTPIVKIIILLSFKVLTSKSVPKPHCHRCTMGRWCDQASVVLVVSECRVLVIVYNSTTLLGLLKTSTAALCTLTTYYPLPLSAGVLVNHDYDLAMP